MQVTDLNRPTNQTPTSGPPTPEEQNSENLGPENLGPENLGPEEPESCSPQGLGRACVLGKADPGDAKIPGRKARPPEETPSSNSAAALPAGQYPVDVTVGCQTAGAGKPPVMSVECRAAGGQPPTAEVLVSSYQAGLWRYLRFLGCDTTRAEDFVQETFLVILRESFEYRGPAATWSYLRTVARNLFLMSLREAERSPVTQNLELVESVWAEFARDDGGDTQIELLKECVSQLDGRARQAVDLRYRHDQSRDQIANCLQMTCDGVKTLLRRTRQLLRECVQRRCRQLGI